MMARYNQRFGTSIHHLMEEKDMERREAELRLEGDQDSRYEVDTISSTRKQMLILRQ